MHLTIRLYNFHEPSNLACIVQITILLAIVILHMIGSNSNSPFSRYPSWEVGGVDLSPLFFLASGLSPHTDSSIFTISSQSCFMSHAKVITYLAFSVGKSSLFQKHLFWMQLFPTEHPTCVCVAPSTGSGRRLRSSVRQGTQRTAPCACFDGPVKEGVTWESQWMDGSILSTRWIPS